MLQEVKAEDEMDMVAALGVDNLFTLLHLDLSQPRRNPIAAAFRSLQ